MKTIAWLAGVGTLLAGALYMVVSLNRWEWNRALFFGLIVLIAEVGLATGLVLRKLARLAHSSKRPDPRHPTASRGCGNRPESCACSSPSWSGVVSGCLQWPGWWIASPRRRR